MAGLIITLGLAGYALFAIAMAVNSWTFAKRAAQAEKRPSFRWLHGGIVSLAVYLPVILAFGAFHLLTHNGLRTWANGFALCICATQLAAAGATWSRLTDKQCCARLFGLASVLMCILSAAVVHFYTTLWSSANHAKGYDPFLFGIGILLSTPFWFGLHLGASSIATIAAVLFARTLPHPAEE